MFTSAYEEKKKASPHFFILTVSDPITYTVNLYSSKRNKRKLILSQLQENLLMMFLLLVEGVS